MSGRAPVVLVVDDSVQDAALVIEAFRELKRSTTLRVVDSVDAAIAYFEGRPPFAEREANPLPAVMLLDIQMPAKSGFELLTWLRGRPDAWRRVPVIMLTTSHDFVEIRKAYDLGANSFLVKPTGFDELVEAMRQVAEYWLDRNRFA